HLLRPRAHRRRQLLARPSSRRDRIRPALGWCLGLALRTSSLAISAVVATQLTAAVRLPSSLVIESASALASRHTRSSCADALPMNARDFARPIRADWRRVATAE